MGTKRVPTAEEVGPSEYVRKPSVGGAWPWKSRSRRWKLGSETRRHQRLHTRLARTRLAGLSGGSRRRISSMSSSINSGGGGGGGGGMIAACCRSQLAGLSVSRRRRTCGLSRRAGLVRWFKIGLFYIYLVGKLKGFSNTIVSIYPIISYPIYPPPPTYKRQNFCLIFRPLLPHYLFISK